MEETIDFGPEAGEIPEDKLEFMEPVMFSEEEIYSTGLQTSLTNMDTRIQAYNTEQRSIAPQMIQSRISMAEGVGNNYPTNSLVAKDLVHEYTKEGLQQMPGQPGLDDSVSGYDYDETRDWTLIGRNKHNPITGLSGTIAYRNQNPGALKLEYKGAILGSTVTESGRDRSTAIARAKELYDGVVTLDRAGFIVFDSVESGKAAQIGLQVRRFKKDTVETMLPKYAVKDGSGDTHHKAYAKAIYDYGDKNGVDLRDKLIGDMTKNELNIMTMAQARVEGGIA